MEAEWKQLEALLDKFGQTDISELELETEKLKLHLKKEQKAGSESFLLLEGEGREKARVLEAGKKEAAEEEKTGGEIEEAKEKEEGRAVKAPLVGTFYAAPEPGAEPYVREGQKVKKGDVIGLIEAMKIMNEIQSPCDGRIRKILVENGSFVAYDELLLYIEE